MEGGAGRFLDQRVTHRRDRQAQHGRHGQHEPEMPREGRDPENREDDRQHCEMPDEEAVRPAADRQRDRARQDAVMPARHEGQWCEQREAHDGTECDLGEVLPRCEIRERFGACQRGGRGGEGDHREDAHGETVRGEPVHPGLGSGGEFGEDHARREPGQETRQPVGVVDVVGGGHRHPRPQQRHSAHHDQQRDAEAGGVPAQAAHGDGEQGQQEIERHLDRQAPHLGQPLGEGQRDEDLLESQIRPPHRGPTPGVGQEPENQDHHGPVGGQDTGRAGEEVTHRRRARSEAAGGSGVGAPQQETGQGEEQGDGEIEARPHPAEEIAVYCSGLECDVGDQHAHRGEAPHSFEGRKESAHGAVPLGAGGHRVQVCRAGDATDRADRSERDDPVATQDRRTVPFGGERTRILPYRAVSV